MAQSAYCWWQGSSWQERQAHVTSPFRIRRTSRSTNGMRGRLYRGHGSIRCLGSTRPITLGLFVAPLAIPLSYALGFSLLTAGAGIALVLCADGLAEYPGWSRRTCYYLLMGTTAVVFARYDVFPALAAVLAVEGGHRGEWNRAWAWAVLGGLLKLFPFLLLPGFLLVERAQTGRWAPRRMLIAVVPVALVTAGQLVAAPRSIWSSLSYQLHRGFELSSLQGSVAFLSDPLHTRWISGFGAVELAGPGHLAISLVVTAVAGAALLTVWRLARRGRLSVVAVSLAVLSARGPRGEELRSAVPGLASTILGLLAYETRLGGGSIAYNSDIPVALRRGA